MIVSSMERTWEGRGPCSTVRTVSSLDCCSLKGSAVLACCLAASCFVQAQGSAQAFCLLV